MKNFFFGYALVADTWAAPLRWLLLAASLRLPLFALLLSLLVVLLGTREGCPYTCSLRWLYRSFYI